MTTCEKASIICNKTQYREATFIEKMKLQFHLLICKTCSTFSKQNSTLTTLCEKANLQTLSEQEKIKMKEKLQNKG